MFEWKVISMKLVKVILIFFALTFVIIGIMSVLHSEVTFTQPEGAFDYIRISAIYDGNRAQEYLYVFDSRNGNIWKYNMDEPEKQPKYIGRMTELGNPLEKIKSK